jgi:hypothetical protein
MKKITLVFAALILTTSISFAFDKVITATMQSYPGGEIGTYSQMNILELQDLADQHCKTANAKVDKLSNINIQIISDFKKLRGNSLTPTAVTYPHITLSALVTCK